MLVLYSALSLYDHAIQLYNFFLSIAIFGFFISFLNGDINIIFSGSNTANISFLLSLLLKEAWNLYFSVVFVFFKEEFKFILWISSAPDRDFCAWKVAWKVIKMIQIIVTFFHWKISNLTN